MTLTERKTNPAITTMFVRTLTEPEMEKTTGGDYNWKLIILCDQLGIHDMVRTGEYEYGYFCGKLYRYPLLKCSRCGYRDKGAGEEF